jgi:RNA polymerase sigma factor (sigma-70 family)
MIAPVVDMEVHGNPPVPESRAPPRTVADRMTAAYGSQSYHRARFRTVYDTNYHRVLGYALRRAASREDAEDAVAETFLTAWRRLEEMPHGSDARPWLYGVARNALANQRRSERRRGRLRGRLRAEPSSPAWDRADANEELASVAAAFARLGEEDRELLALAAWEELDAGEIATVLGCSRNAATIRLHRARRRLARQLQSTDAGPARWSLISVETEQALRREPR